MLKRSDFTFRNIVLTLLGGALVVDIYHLPFPVLAILGKAFGFGIIVALIDGALVALGILLLHKMGYMSELLPKHRYFAPWNWSVTTNTKIKKFFTNLYLGDDDQKSITSWGEKHYPGMEASNAIKDLFEETTELAAAANVCTLDELLDVVRKSWKKSDKGNAEDIPGEIGDVLICAHWAASKLGYDSQKELNRKMKVNRTKTVEESQARLAKKRKLMDK